jgi:hypothetical protein
LIASRFPIPSSLPTHAMLSFRTIRNKAALNKG